MGRAGGSVVRMPVACVIGTRPEAVKLAPIVHILQGHEYFRPVVLATGQQRELLALALADFGLVPDIDLDLMRGGQSPASVLGAAVPPLAEIFSNLRPAAVLVQGDTTTALAAAHAGALTRMPVGHVEAGLRTGDRHAPFPEELNRRVIAQLADLHFAPTAAARTALLGEGIADARIHVTGNTGIDALRLVEARLAANAGVREAAAAAVPPLDPDRRLILVTAHRRENHGPPIESIAEAIAQLAGAGAEIVLPVHPHPAVAGPLRARLAGVPHVHLVPPLGHAAFVWLLGRADLVLTDSGGVQEEAPALGVPALVLRDVTERGESIASGNARLVGTVTEAIVAAVRDQFARGRLCEPALPYGDGTAAPRIVAVLERCFASVRAGAELVH